MPCGPSCRGQSLLPLAHPTFVRGRKNPASRGRKCGASGVSEVTHQRLSEDNSGKPSSNRPTAAVESSLPKEEEKHGAGGENRPELAPHEDRLGSGQEGPRDDD